MRVFPIFMAFACALVFATGCGEDSVMTEYEIREAIRQGVDRSEVEAFLAGNEITFSVLEDEELSLESDLSGKPYLVVARYVAIVPNVRRSMLFYRESILIKIDVGADGKVLGVNVESALTGP